ncbi:hypothetical protein I3760_03G018600 [Carya illinoinensis]|nr:hypothetical protein I3760_03G018600 [Carya illinoinensis]
MGRSCFLSILLASSLLVLCFSHVEGFGRKVMETVEHEDSTFRERKVLLENRGG